MNPDHTLKTRSVWPTLQIKIPCRKKWAWAGIFKPAEPHIPQYTHSNVGSKCWHHWSFSQSAISFTLTLYSAAAVFFWQCHFNNFDQYTTLCLKKKFPPLYSLQLCQIFTDFHTFCVGGQRMKFATKPIQHYPPHLKRVATLPWEIKNSNFW